MAHFVTIRENVYIKAMQNDYPSFLKFQVVKGFALLFVKMDDEKARKFIGLVKMYKNIWDISDVAYHDRNAKEAAWKKIAEEMGEGDN